MSSYHTILTVSNALRQLLLAGFAGTPEAMAEADLVLDNPSQMSRNPAKKLSVWLYQVTENEFVKNQPASRGANAAEGQLPPLALNLFYLITPFTTASESDHLLLGRVMLTMYDNAIVFVRNPSDGDFEELRIVLCRLTLEELTRIWEALREPYRLSVCYQVRVAHVDSLRDRGRARVIDRLGSFQDVPAPTEAIS